MNRSLIVIDNFYEDPEAVRQLALAQAWYRKPGATYPGREAVVPERDWEPERARLRAEIDEAVDAPCPKSPAFPQGKFRLAMAADETTRVDRVHVDQQRWSAIVYLTPDEHCRGGLALYRHRPRSSTTWDERWFIKNHSDILRLPPDERRAQILEFFRDPEQFEQIGLVPMAYNRAILLMAHVFHGTGVAFGDSPERGRLTQDFEFYA